MSLHRAFSLGAIGIAATLVVACGGGDDPNNIVVPPPHNSAAAGAPPAGAPTPGLSVGAADAGADGATADGLPPLPIKEFQEGDFDETDRSRDPFRSFEHLFMNEARARVNLQRQVLIDRYALDELKIVGIVTRGSPRALLVDPAGLGWVTRVGDFVGRAELVHSGGPTGTDVAINWRVDRIRDTDVVLVREDPSHPEIPPTTRVIALYPVNESGETKEQPPQQMNR